MNAYDAVWEHGRGGSLPACPLHPGCRQPSREEADPTPIGAQGRFLVPALGSPASRRSTATCHLRGRHFVTAARKWLRRRLLRLHSGGEPGWQRGSPAPSAERPPRGHPAPPGLCAPPAGPAPRLPGTLRAVSLSPPVSLQLLS